MGLARSVISQRHPWHICGTQERETLSSRVSQRQPTTHEMADRKPSQRVSVALSIRRSSVRARRGPPGDFTGTFVLLRGLRSVSYPPELPRGACHVDVESGTLNPQVVVTNAAGLTIGLRTSDGL